MIEEADAGRDVGRDRCRRHQAQSSIVSPGLSADLGRAVGAIEIVSASHGRSLVSLVRA